MKITVVGGGPAGIMAAGTAARGGAEVTLIEKNLKLGKKLFITGKGRCNVTNNCTGEEFIKNVVTNPRFLYSGIKAFSPQDTINFFEERGCRLVTERGNRVFPESGKSSDILSVLQKYISESKIKLMLECVCGDIEFSDYNFTVRTNKGTAKSDRLILACGGTSYTATGSTGEMFETVKKAGHTITPLKPALCPLIVKESFVSGLEGLSLKNINAKAVYNGKTVYEEFGEMLFTHNGLSGPVILSMSSYINKLDVQNVNIIIDLKPALDIKTLILRINRDFEEAKNKLFKNSLNELLPKSLIPVIIVLSGTDPEKQVNSVTSQERKNLAGLLKNLSFCVKSLGSLEGAIVTSGGVSVDKINPSTMESKIIKGLYFAGEMIDVDALTGGFNIQAALSTGYLAGRSASKITGENI